MRLTKEMKIEILLKNQTFFEVIYYEQGHPSEAIDKLHPQEFKCCEHIIKPEETGMVEEHHKFTMFNHSKSFTHKIYERIADFEMDLTEQEIKNMIKAFQYSKQIMKQEKIKDIEEMYVFLKIIPEKVEESFEDLFFESLFEDEELKIYIDDITECYYELLTETKDYYGIFPKMNNEECLFDFTECFKKIVKKTFRY